MAKIIVCKECGQGRPHKAKGLCGACYDRQWEGEHREARREYRREYRKEHLAEICEGQRVRSSRYYYRHREKCLATMRRYHEEHREEYLAYQRRWQHQWWKKNAEIARAISRRYYWEHHTEQRLRHSQWKKQNRNQCTILENNRRARKLCVPNTLTQEQIDFERTIAQAMWPQEDLHLHHLVPISRGGGHTWGNIIFIPASLNLKIHCKLPQEIYRQLSLV